MVENRLLETYSVGAVGAIDIYGVQSISMGCRDELGNGHVVPEFYYLKPCFF